MIQNTGVLNEESLVYWNNQLLGISKADENFKTLFNIYNKR